MEDFVQLVQDLTIEQQDELKRIMLEMLNAHNSKKITGLVA